MLLMVAGEEIVSEALWQGMWRKECRESTKNSANSTQGYSTWAAHGIQVPAELGSPLARQPNTPDASLSLQSPLGSSSVQVAPWDRQGEQQFDSTVSF